MKLSHRETRQRDTNHDFITDSGMSTTTKKRKKKKKRGGGSKCNE